MSTGEIAYLSMAVAAFVTYMGLLAYGMIVASERPQQAATGAANQAGGHTLSKAA